MIIVVSVYVHLFNTVIIIIIIIASHMSCGNVGIYGLQKSYKKS